MRKKTNKLHSRRQLLTGTARYAALGALAVGAGGAVIKRRRLLREGKCVNRGICKDCGVFTDCGLPRALSVKQHTGGYSNG